MAKKPPSKRKTRESAEHEPDVFEASLRAPDRAALAGAVTELGLDVDHQHPEERAADAEVVIRAFVTAAQIKELEGRRWKVRVARNLSEVGRARQKEVARGDRFKGGTIAPTGLGKKIREDR